MLFPAQVGCTDYISTRLDAGLVTFDSSLGQDCLNLLSSAACGEGWGLGSSPSSTCNGNYFWPAVPLGDTCLETADCLPPGDAGYVDQNGWGAGSPLGVGCDLGDPPGSCAGVCSVGRGLGASCLGFGCAEGYCEQHALTDGGQSAVCIALGISGDSCIPGGAVPTCVDGDYCRSLVDAGAACQPLVGVGGACTVSVCDYGMFGVCECQPDLYCNVLDAGSNVGSCQPPVVVQAQSPCNAGGVSSTEVICDAGLVCGSLPDSNSFTCQPLSGVGGPCDALSCGPQGMGCLCDPAQNLYCDPKPGDSSAGTCQLQKATGQPCNPALTNEDGYAPDCIGGEEMCLMGLCAGLDQGIGQPCLAGWTGDTGPCINGAWCSGSPGTCEAAGQLGASCTANSLGSSCLGVMNCLPGSAGDACTAPEGAGGACSCPPTMGEFNMGQRPAQCTSALCQQFLTCVTFPDAGAGLTVYAGSCSPLLTLGQACDPSLDLCAQGSCSAQSKQCVPSPAAGSSCDAGG